jgi:hypothetical protein
VLDGIAGQEVKGFIHYVLGFAAGAGVQQVIDGLDKLFVLQVDERVAGFQVFTPGKRSHVPLLLPGAIPARLKYKAKIRS